MIRALPFVFALAVLMPGLAAAQQSCITPAGTCALSSGAPGKSCACFTTHGAVQGTIGPASSPASNAAQYCCTKAGKIGPLPNFAKQVGQACSVIPASRVPANGVACN
jgi:hypothetical protein